METSPTGAKAKDDELVIVLHIEEGESSFKIQEFSFIIL